MGATHVDREQVLKSYLAGLEMLMPYNEEVEYFLSQIVTGNKMWQYYWTLECKNASMEWKTANKTVLQKFK